MRSILALCITLWISACATQRGLPPLTPPGAPDPGLADRTTLPYDPAYPRVAIVVEPMALVAPQHRRDDKPTRSGWGPWGWSLPKTADDDADCCTLPDQADDTLAAALTVDLERALASIGNVQVIDYARYAATANPAALLPKGYVGPFVVGGAVQEFNEHLDTTLLGTGTVLGTIGAAMSIAGAVAGQPGLAWAGVGLAVISPAFDYRVARRTGSVLLGLHIYDSRAGLIVSTLTPHGTSTDRSGLNGFALFGFGRPAPAYSLSLLGRAHRNAFNAVTTDVWAQLKPLI